MQKFEGPRRDPNPEGRSAQVSRPLPQSSRGAAPISGLKPFTPPFPQGTTIAALEPRNEFLEIHADGRAEKLRFTAQVVSAEIELPSGTAKTITALPPNTTYEQYRASGKPVVTFIPGWWGTDEQNCAAAEMLAAKFGFAFRAVNPEGTGKNTRELLELLRDEKKVIIAHSAGYRWFQRAYGSLSETAKQSIERIIPFEPLLDTGGWPAFKRYWAGLYNIFRNGEVWKSLCGVGRFAGQVIPFGPKKFLQFTLDSTVSLSVTLFGPGASEEFMNAYRRTLGKAGYIDYGTRLFVESALSRLGLHTPHKFHLPKDRITIVHCGASAPYTEDLHSEMAARIGGTLESVPGAYHQALAIPEQRRSVVEKFAEIINRSSSAMQKAVNG